MTPQNELYKAELLLAEHPLQYLKVQRELDENDDYDSELQMTQCYKAHKAFQLVSKVLENREKLERNELIKAQKLLIQCYLNINEPDYLEDYLLASIEDLIALDASKKSVIFAIKACISLIELEDTLLVSEVHDHIRAKSRKALEHYYQMFKMHTFKKQAEKYWDAGDLNAALDSWRVAAEASVEINDKLDCLNSAAYMAYELKKYDLGLEILEPAILLDPTFTKEPIILTTLCELYDGLGKEDEFFKYAQLAYEKYYKKDRQEFEEDLPIIKKYLDDKRMLEILGN